MSDAANINPLPGTRTGRTITPRQILHSLNGVSYSARGVIDSTLAYDGKNTGYEYELRAGTIMGKITATNLWVPCRRTTVLTGTGSVTTAVLTDSRHFKAGDKITIGTDAVTIATIDYTTDTITWSGAVTIAVAEAVFATAAQHLAGAEIARCVLGEFIDLYDEQDRVVRNKSFGKGLTHGAVQSPMILGDKAAILAATHYLSGLQWSDQLGQSA